MHARARSSATLVAHAAERAGRPRPRREWQTATGALAGLLGLSACAGGTTSPGAEPVAATEEPARPDLALVDVAFDFDEGGVVDDVVPTATNRGVASIEVEVTTAGGGLLLWTRGAGGPADHAVRTPAYAATGDVPAAAIVVRPLPGAESDLDPGTADVVLGADFQVDERRTEREEDDGDNLVQRGRDGDPAQLKIQVDHGVPSCRVVGRDADVVVAAEDEVLPDHWYRVTCTRSVDGVTLVVLDLEREDAEPAEWNSRTDPGALWFGAAPLSVGAKVTEDGLIDPSSVDQFNGVIDRVVFDVAR